MSDEQLIDEWLMRTGPPNCWTGSVGAVAAAVHRLRLREREWREPPILAQLCRLLGWQGGTIHEALAEVERLVNSEKIIDDPRLRWPAEKPQVNPVGNDEFRCVSCGKIIGRVEFPGQICRGCGPMELSSWA